MFEEEENLYTIILQKPALFGTHTSGDIQISVRAKDLKDALDKMLVIVRQSV